jgi:hypothetical protein
LSRHRLARLSATFVALLGLAVPRPAAARERESSDEPRLRFPRRCFIGRLAREETGSKCRRKRKAKDS